MLPPYDRLRDRARQIAARFPPPDFYRVHQRAHRLSAIAFGNDEVVADLRRYLADRLEDDFGHGVKHAAKVCLDAGALMAIEAPGRGFDRDGVSDQIRLVQCAGLLHDIKRKQRDHAGRGADEARRILTSYPFSVAEIEDVAMAIRNHEAFKPVTPVNTVGGALVSDCLYDADKFRWGPDNFTDTLWEMVAFYRPTLREFLDHYPRGMATLEAIKPTFRTPCGKKYGPRFIDQGIAIGEELHAAIQAEFAQYL